MEPKRLYRSRENRVLCGVCGGIAEYFNVDPVLIRLGMVLFICASVGTGLLAYFIASVIMPDQIPLSRPDFPVMLTLPASL